jgi:stage V sporulation protein AA
MYDAVHCGGFLYSRSASRAYYQRNSKEKTGPAGRKMGPRSACKRYGRVGVAQFLPGGYGKGESGMSEVLYLRLRKRLSVKPQSVITLGDICQLFWDGVRERELVRLPVYQVRPEDGDLLIIDIMQVIRKLRTMYPELSLEIQGAPQVIVEVQHPRKTANLLLVALVWLILFIGSGLAMMNFHTDVSMLQVHQRIFYLITGKASQQPLWLQIPYSVGIGLGMVLFFNHIFEKRITEEPSPLEVELFLYQQNLDQYYIQNENRENQRSKP